MCVCVCVVYSYADACKRHNKNERHSSLEKYTSHFIWKVVCERELETEQNCNILTPTLMAISVVSFLFSRVAQPEARRPSSLLGAGFLYRILSPTGLVSKTGLVSNWSGLQLTDFLSSPSYIIVQRTPSWGRHKLHSFNPSTVKVIISWSTGCICYLQRCISYFDRPAGS